MGLFDGFNKGKQKDQENEEIKAYGWDAIQTAIDKVYPDQKPRNHYGTLIKWRLGGNDPLDGISIYDCEDYWHFITFGLTELYEKENLNIFTSAEENREISGYGMELTFKLKKGDYEDEDAEIKCICAILQSIARLTFTKGEIFRPYEYLYTGQKQGIDTKTSSNITGFITAPETKMPEIDTPNGRVTFLGFVGVTDSELQKIINRETTVNELYDKLGTDVTAYDRSSLYE